MTVFAAAALHDWGQARDAGDQRFKAILPAQWAKVPDSIKTRACGVEMARAAAGATEAADPASVHGSCVGILHPLQPSTTTT
jgi:hypothetical protein